MSTKIIAIICLLISCCDEIASLNAKSKFLRPPRIGNKLSENRNPSDVWNDLDRTSENLKSNFSGEDLYHRASSYHLLGLNIYAHFDLVDALCNDIPSYEDCLLLNAKVALQMNDPEASLDSLQKYYKHSGVSHTYDIVRKLRKTINTNDLNSENPLMKFVADLEQYFNNFLKHFESFYPQLHDEIICKEFISNFLERVTDRIELKNILKKVTYELNIRKEEQLLINESCSNLLKMDSLIEIESSEFLQAIERIFADIAYSTTTTTTTTTTSNGSDDEEEVALLKDVAQYNSNRAEEFTKMSINTANHYSMMKMDEYREEHIKGLASLMEKTKANLVHSSKIKVAIEQSFDILTDFMNQINEKHGTISYIGEKLGDTLQFLKLAKPVVEAIIVSQSPGDSDEPLSLLSESIRKYIEKYDTYYEICDKNDLIVSRLRRHYRSGPGGQRSYENIMHVLRTTSTTMVTTVVMTNTSEVGIDPDYQTDTRVRVAKAPGNKGMALMAEMDFSPQDVVFIENAVVSFCGDKSDRCSHCHRPLPLRENGEPEGDVVVKDIVKCHCGEVFCSEECMDTADREYHSLLCGTEYKELQRSIVAMNPPSSSSLYKYCLMIKLIAMSIVQGLESPLDLPIMQVLKRSTDLESPPTCNQDMLTSQKSVGIYQEMDRLFREYLGSLYEDNPRIRAEELVQMDSCLTVNSMILGPGVHALMLYGSFINHSCEPNMGYQVTLSGKSERLGVFRAKRSIAAGEELTISYIDHELPHLFRTMALKRQYGFECSCQKCIAEQKFDIIIPE